MATKRARSRAATPKADGLGEQIDRLYELRAQRLEIERRVDDLKRAEAALRADLFHRLGSAKLQSASGASATFTMRPRLVVKIVDPPTFWRYLKRTGAFDLLEQRPVASAFEERRSAGEKIPGVEYDSALTYSLTARKRGGDA